MTGYTVHTGSTEKFSQGWDEIFGKKAGKKKGAATAAEKPAGSSAETKSPTKAKKR